MKDWDSEEQIKAQLRELTERTRKLRRDLDAMIKPGAPSPARAFIHKHDWPKPPSPDSEPPRRRKKP